MIDDGHPVYVIDDEAEVRAAIAFQLAAAGRSVATFTDGAEFMAAAPALTPGCILLDVRMPGQDGIALLATFKARRIDWPVVVMTGHGEVTTAVQAMRAGAIDFIEKPFEEALLFAALANGAAILNSRAAVVDGIRRG